MKKRLIIKTAFLVIPVSVVFLYCNDGGNGAIGGGYYDLGNLYYYLFAISYLVVYETVILVMMLYTKNRNLRHRENTYLFWIVLAILAGHLACFTAML